ncbi:lytic transglycosylase domain-containing protein [Bradyrhizobium sp. WSM 1744]|uniref:Lytic transglycosylase domain-containing protein n=2 Tax=Bradyrhizobium archetypum TaxID=2721160 RepID=A0A7Y4M3U4_9BRAD|nr:lytic transglycosylase domain-containing protein [Bradyrhizobium archetypum]
MSTSDFYPAGFTTMEWKLMRYLFAAVIAVFVVAVDLESSDIRSLWTERSFVIAEAQSEPASIPNSHASALRDMDSKDGTATAWVESSQAETTGSIAAPYQTATATDAAAHAAASVSDDSKAPDLICEAVRAAAEENDIPIGFLVRLLWQESRFRTTEVSSAGAQGIAQFMPQTAVEMGLRDPFDPLQAIPASARFLRKLYAQFGNLGLAAAAYNAGGGRIEKWLSRRSSLPKETRAYVKIITGQKAEAWIDEESTVYMPTDLPHKAPCEGVGGLSRQDQIAAVNVDLTPSASAMLRKAEAEESEAKKNAAVRKLRVAASSAARSVAAASRKIGARAVLLAKASRKPGKQSVVRLASASSRTKSSKAAREL